MGERVFMKGGEALAEAAIRVGCRFFSGYPITPQNEVPEYFARRLPEVGGHYLQGESEVASVHMLFGAAATGTRAMTSSSSCGISLMVEGISCMAGARLPAVIMSVQRGGPGVGAIQPAQQDYWQATRAMGNGGNKHIVFSPGGIQEAVDLMDMAFTKAERDRNPVIMLMDGTVCSIMEPVVLPDMKEPTLAGADWRPDGHQFSRPRRFITCGATSEAENIQAAQMYERWEQEDVMVEETNLEDAEIVLTGYGVCARVASTIMNELRSQGHKVGLIRPITVYPFPKASYRKLDPRKVKMVIDIEMAIPGQMADDVRANLDPAIPVKMYGRTAGNVPSDQEVMNAVRKFMEEGEGK